MEENAYNPTKAWLALVVGLAVVVLGTITGNQIAPIMIDLREEFGLSLVQGGMLQSVIGTCALIVAIPAGLLIMRLGVRNASLVVCAIALVGGLSCLFAQNYEMMLVGRVFQGLSSGLGTVLSPQIAAKFFPPDKRGVPMSLVSAIYTAAYFLMMNIAVPIKEAATWRGLWVLFLVFMVIVAVLSIAFLPKKANEPQDAASSEEENTPEFKAERRKAWFTPMAYLPPLVFILFNIGYFAIVTYMPTYLVEVVGATQAQSNFATSWNAIAGFPAAIIAGVLMGKMKVPRRKFLPMIIMFVLAACYFAAFRVQSLMAATALLIATGFFASFVPPSLNTIGPDILPRHTAVAISLVIFGQNIGMSLGPLVAGAIVESAGDWTACSIPIAAFAVVGGLICLAIKVKDLTQST